MIDVQHFVCEPCLLCCLQVLDSLAQVNAERQELEERVARFWSERQEILLEAEVRGEGGGRDVMQDRRVLEEGSERAGGGGEEEGRERGGGGGRGGGERKWE